MNAVDRCIVNALQGGFPVCERPFAEVATRLGIAESELIGRLRQMVESGTLSRFGPLYDAERMGGAVTLAAMAVPPDRFDDVAALVNAYPEVAHNYARDHLLNMWFVVAVDRAERIAEVIDEIATATGLAVHNMPKLEEYFLELKLVA
jgi:DNA-binding Lrp family transcriptional regulator